MRHLGLSNDKARRLALLGTVLAGGLMASLPAAAATPPATGTLTPTQQASGKLLSDAQKALQAGNGRLALILLKNALTADPHNGPVRVLYGRVLALTDDAGGAEREFRQARKDGAPPALVLPPLFDVMMTRGEYQVIVTQFPDPGSSSGTPEAAIILIARALALQNLNKPAEAIDAIERSMALRRDDRALLARARIALLQGKRDEARKFVDEAIPLAKGPDAMLFKASLLLSEGQYQPGLDFSNQILAKYPGNLGARYTRIQAYLGLKQDDKAKAEVDEILSKSSTLPMAIYYRALLLARAGDVKGAWNQAQNLSSEFRDSEPRAALMISEMASEAGNADTAASILGRVLSKDPNSPIARMRLATLRLKQNNAAEALKALEPVKDSPDLRIQELLSDAYIRLNRPADALVALQKMDANGKAPPTVKRSIALLEIQSGKTEQGIKDLAPILAKNPTDAGLVAAFVQGLLRAKRYPEALAAADRLGKDPNQHVRALILRGSILTAQNNMAGAQAAFDNAVGADTNGVAGLFARGEFLAASQKYAPAAQDLRAVLARDPKNLAALLKLADIAARQDQDQEVRKSLGQAIAVAPQSAVARKAFFNYLMARRDYKNALPVASEFARLQPSNGDAVAMLGTVQFSAGQKKEAIATYRRLAALTPASAAPQLLLGDALWATGDRVGAASAMDAAVKRAPNAANVRSGQIRVLLGSGNKEGALAAARAFQSANPGTAADVLLSETLDNTNQHGESIAVLTKSLAEHPSNVVLLKLANFAAKANDAGRVTDLLSKWLADHPDDLAVRMEYANFLMDQGQGVRAIPLYEAALKQNPSNPIALNNLGWLIQGNDPKRALALLNQAQKLSPESPDIADTLGWLKVQQKDAAGGLELLSKAHSLKPGDGAITYHLVLALDANGKRDAARGLLKALLAGNAQFKDRPAAVQLAAKWH